MQNQISHYLEQLVSNPGDDNTLETLVRLFQEKDTLPAFARFLLDRAEEAQAPAQRAGLLLRAAEVTGLNLGDADAARALFERALAMNGEGNVQLEARAGLLSLRGEWGAVLSLYHQHLEALEAPADKSRILCRMGRIYRLRLSDNTNAMKAYQTAFKVDRDCLEALVAAREIYAEVGNWKLVRQLLQLELQQRQQSEDSDGMVNVLVLLGDVLRLHLEGADTAAACYSSALERDPWSQAARHGLVALGYEPPPEPPRPEAPAEDPPEAPEPTVMFEHSPAPSAQEVLETQAVETIDRPELRGAPSEDAQAEMGDDDLDADIDTDIDVDDLGADDAPQAQEPAELAPAIDPDDSEEPPSVLMEQEPGYDDPSAAPHSMPPAEDDAISVDMAEPAEEAAAEEVIAEEVEVEEAEVEAAMPAESVAEEAAAEEVIAEEAAVEEAEAEAPMPADASTEEAAAEESVAEESVAEESVAEESVAEESVAEESVAEDADALVAEPAEHVEASAPAVIEAQPAVSAQAAPVQAEPAQVATAQAPAGKGWQDKVAALIEAGRLRAALSLTADHNGDVSDLLLRAISENPNDESTYEALRGRALDKDRWAAVRAAFEGAAADHDSVALQRQAIRVTLYELGDVDKALADTKALDEKGRAGELAREVADVRAAAAGSWRRLQQELETRHSALSSEDQAMAVFGRVAEVARALGQEDRRLDALRQLVQGAPAAVDARRELKAIFRDKADWRNYAEVLKAEGAAASGQEQIDALWELADVYRDHLRQDVMVVNTLNQLLDCDPEPLRVLDALAAQYEKMRRYPDLVGVLQKRADVAPSLEESVNSHLQIARLYLDRFSNQGEALKAFEKVLELAPLHPEAVEQLKQMYDKRREYEKLIDLHEAEIALLEDPQVKGARYKEIALLASEKLRRSNKGPELWQRVLEFNPADLEALSALEALYEQAKEFEAFAQIAEKKLTVLEDPQEILKLAEKLGRTYTERVKDNDAAIRAWRRVLDVDPANRRAQDALKKLLIDVQDWDALADFFALSDDWAGYVRTIETLAGTIKEDDTKIDLLFRAAAVWRDKLDQTDRAVRSLERVMSMDATNLRAARELAPIYEAAGDPRKLSQVLEIALAHLEGGAPSQDTREVLLQLARLYEDRLRNPEGAFDFYARAFALYDFAAPEDGADDLRWDDAFTDIERVAAGLSAWPEVVNAYNARLDALEAHGHDDAARELRLRLGRVLHKELGQAQAALDCYDLVLESDPAELRALAAQEEIFQQLGEFDRLAQVFDKRLALTEDHAERVAILSGKALLLEEHQEDREGAVACYREVVAIEPDNRAALQALHRLYEQLGDYDALADTLRQEIALVQARPAAEVKPVDGLPLDPDALQEAAILRDGASLEQWLLLKVQLGLVAAQALMTDHARAEALDALRDVLAVDPDQDQALEIMEEIGREPAFSREVAQTLEPLYHQKAAWEPLVQAREILLAHQDQPQERVARLLSIGAVLGEQLGDFERAFEAYGRALREDPRSHDAMHHLETIADATDLWGPLVALWEDIGLDLADDHLRLDYQVRAARALEIQLGDAPRAQQAWRAVLALDPDHQQALLHLEHLYAESQQWHELDEIFLRRLDLLNRQLEQTGDDALKPQIEELRFRQALLHEEMLEDPSGAIDIYRALLDEDARNLRARQSLDRLLASEGRHEEQAENLQHQLSLVQDHAEALDLKCRLASLKESQLFATEDAIALWGEVLRDDPSHEGALAPLERIVQQDPDHQEAVVAILDPLYRHAQSWDKLVALAELRLPSVEDPARRVSLLHEIASLHEQQLQSPEEAFVAMTRALREDVRDPNTTQALYRLAEDTNRWDDLASAFEQEIPGASEDSLGASLHMRAAAIREQRLGDVDAATEHYRSVLDDQPEHMGAIDNLERIYSALEMWPELVEILLHKATLLEDAPQQRDLLHRAATILEEMMDDAPRASEVYERALSIDGANQTTIDNLERLYIHAERWLDLIDLLQRKLDLTDDPAQRRLLFCQRGTVYDTQLEDPYQAIDAWRAVLDLYNDDREALAALATLFQSTEQWHELLENLERQVALAASPEDAFALRQHIGALYETHLQDPMRAVEVYQAILAEDPNFAPAADALEGMIGRGEAQAAAAEVLQPIYRRGERWQDLVDLHEILVAASDDPIAALEHLKEIAQLHELRLNAPEAAFGAYGRALAIAPDDEGVLETLERLAGELDAWEPLVALLEEQVAATTDGEAARRLATRMGRILEEELFDANRAIEKYRMALDIEMSDRASMAALDRLYGKAARWEELAHILNEEILHEEDLDARVQLRMRLGAVYESTLNDAEQAISTYRDVLLAHANHPGALEALERMFASGVAPMEIGEILEPIYEEGQSWEKLVDVYMVQLDQKSDPDERFAHLQRIAELYRQRLNDTDRAFVVLGNALSERPADEATREELERIAEQTGAWPEVAGFYTEALERADGDHDVQRQLLLGIARIMDERLAEVEAAEQAYLRVLEMDPQDEPALHALDRIYTQEQRWTELAEVLRREISLTYEEDRVISLSYRLGVLYEQQLNDLDSAVDTYQSILNLSPLHPEALNALEHIYLAREEWEPLFLIYERQAERKAERNEDPAEVFTRMASLADQMLYRPLDAIDLWNRVLDLRPQDSLAMFSLAELYEREGRFGDLAQILERQVEITPDPQQQAALLSRMGRVWFEELMNEDQALDAWSRVLKLDPMNAQALFACRDLYQRTGQYEDLVDVIERIITLEGIERDDLLDLYVQLGSIHGDMLGRANDAIEAWRAVLTLDPAHRMALNSLEQLFLDQNRWEEAVDILARKVEALQASGDESDQCLNDQIELLLRIADLWESHIGQPHQAVSAYEAVLEIDPGHMQASRALEALYQDQQDWNKLVELFLSRRDYIEDPFEGLEILRAAARIYEEQLTNHEAAFLVMCRAFMENPQDDQTAADLERLARVTENWETLITLYNNVLESVEDGAEALGLHIKMARWLADEMANFDHAVAHYRLALEIEPDNTDVMAALEAIFEKQARWAELVAILELRADLTPQDDLRIELYRKIGDIWTHQLEDHAQAVEAWRTILRIDPTDLGALEALERLHEISASWTDLIEVLQRKAAVLFEPEQVVSIKYRVANLWEQQVGSVERAVEAYRDVLSVEQSHRDSREALERLYQHLERWHDLLDVYDLQLSLAHDGREQIATYHKMARVYEEELQDIERAVEAYGRVLLLDERDLFAIEQLERLYQQLERWDDLVQTLERHVEASPERTVKVEILRFMSQVLRDQLLDHYRAIEALRRLLELDPRHIDALYDVAALYEHISDWENALAAYEALAGLINDVQAGVELHHRMGTIREQNLLDLSGAEDRFRFALELQPDHKPSLDALRSLYERRDEWPGVVAILRQEEEFTLDLEAKAQLLCQIGQINEFKLHDELRALDYYEQTIELSPENVDAAEPLSRMYLRERRWARALPLLELLVRHRGHDRTQEGLFLLFFNLGQCCEELAQPDRAIKEYGESYELNPNHLPTLLGLGRLLYRRGDYDRALRVYQTITQYHRRELDDAQLLELYFRSGQIQSALNNPRGAQEMFEAALQLDNKHAEVIQSLVELHTEQGQWDDVIVYRRRQLPNVADDLERFAMLREIADISAQHLNNPSAAIQAYNEALQLQPDSVVVLRKMLDIYTGARMWGDSVNVLLRIADLEADPQRKATYLYTIAVIFRDEVGDVASSVDYFNRALDVDLNMLKAFEAIDRILTSQKDWTGLERAYRKMLRRISDNQEAEVNDNLKFLLWKNLGEIYRTRQQNLTSAIEVYRIAVGMRPDDDELHVILADLYERTGSHPEEAITEHKRLIKMNPFRIASYRALFESYLKTGRYDEAWCMASALTFLREANDKEQKFYQDYLEPSPRQPRRQLSPDQWKYLYHAEQDMLTSNIMAILGIHMRQDYYAFNHDVWKLHKRKDLLDLNQPTPFGQVYQWAAQCIAPNPVPYVYFKRDQIEPLRNGNLDPPALIVGPVLFQSIPEHERAFHIGKHLTLARPEHYLGAGFFPTDNLKLLFVAALQFTRPQMNFGLNASQPFVDALKRMQKMPPPVQMQLRQLCEQFYKTGQNPNLSAWLKSLDLTSDRVALLIAGDLLSVCNCIRNSEQQQHGSISKLTPKERIKELVLFSISDSYFELRKQLGLALGQQ